MELEHYVKKIGLVQWIVFDRKTIEAIYDAGNSAAKVLREHAEMHGFIMEKLAGWKEDGMKIDDFVARHRTDLYARIPDRLKSLVRGPNTIVLRYIALRIIYAHLTVVYLNQVLDREPFKGLADSRWTAENIEYQLGKLQNALDCNDIEAMPLETMKKEFHKEAHGEATSRAKLLNNAQKRESEPSYRAMLEALEFAEWMMRTWKKQELEGVTPGDPEDEGNPSNHYELAKYLYETFELSKKGMDWERFLGELKKRAKKIGYPIFGSRKSGYPKFSRKDDQE